MEEGVRTVIDWVVKWDRKVLKGSGSVRGSLESYIFGKLR